MLYSNILYYVIRLDRIMQELGNPN